MLSPVTTPRLIGAPHAFPFAALHDVNLRCIDLLMHAARTAVTPPFSLVASLREPLRRSTPEGRSLAANRGVLLVDMQFSQPDWWRRVSTVPERAFRNSAGRGCFPRQSGIPLARATLTLAWNAVQSDRTIAEVVLGMDPEVATLISSMPLTGIDRFAARHFRRVQPRWADRTDYWRKLLLHCESGQSVSTREVDLRALQLVLADLLHAQRRARASGSQAHPASMDA